MRTIAEFQGTVSETVAAIFTKYERVGPSEQCEIIANGCGFDTLGGEYRVTSRDFRGRRNPTRVYTSLAAALVANTALNAADRRIWHVSTSGRRRLVATDL